MQVVKSSNFGSIKCDFYQGNVEIFMTREQIGRALNYSDPVRAISKIHSRNPERLDRFSVVTKLTTTDGKRYNTTIYSQKGIYEICRWSRQNVADQFMDWTWDVIESIRKHGAYATPDTIENVLNDPEFGIQLLTNLKQEREEREKLEQQRKLDEPYTTFGKVVSNSTASINVGAFAKMMYDEYGIRIGRNRMFRWLRDKGFLIMSGREKNNPKQKYIEQGLFDTSVTVVSRTQGDVESVTPLVTGKGQIKLAEKLLQEYEVNV